MPYQEMMTFTIIECADCFIPFGISQEFESQRRADCSSFYCPRGHSLSYGGITHKEEVKHLRARLSSAQERADHYGRRISSLRGVITKTKRKVHAGRCPYCGEEFKSLKAHMKNQHAEELKKDVEGFK